MKVVFDTNIWISFLLGKRLSSVKDVFLNENIEIYVSDHLLNEIEIVANRPKFKSLISSEALLNLFRLIDNFCMKIDSCEENVNTILRDPKDIFLLAMADSINLNYIVTGDKDLLVLRKYKETDIITFSEFLSLPGFEI